MNAILVVSHSAEAARGIVAIASQMAGERVGIAACGGTDDGELGTSVPSILSALEGLLETSDGVLVIPDLGSAVLAARTAKFWREPSWPRWRPASGRGLTGSPPSWTKPGD